MKRILFVCTGNTCRSPLAEGLGRKIAKESHLDIDFRSAGVYAVDGQSISENSATILREHGVNEPFSSSMLSGELVDWADLILTMTRSHKRAVLSQFPQSADKTHTLKEYVEDNEGRKQLVDTERQIAELQLELSLPQEPAVSEEIYKHLEQLWKQLPDYDISDPFGQSLEVYRACANEINDSLLKLLHKDET